LASGLSIPVTEAFRHLKPYFYGDLIGVTFDTLIRRKPNFKKRDDWGNHNMSHYARSVSKE